MTTKPAPIPTPVVKAEVCSLCDEPWAAHGAEPTVLDCIRLLKARRMPRFMPAGYTCTRCGSWVTTAIHTCVTVPALPYIAPYVSPNPNGTTPWQWPTITCDQGSGPQHV